MGYMDLRRAKASHGPAIGVVGVAKIGIHFYVGDLVWPRHHNHGMDMGTSCGRDHRAEPGIGTLLIIYDPFEGDQCTIPLSTDFDPP